MFVIHNSIQRSLEFEIVANPKDWGHLRRPKGLTVGPQTFAAASEPICQGLSLAFFVFHYGLDVLAKLLVFFPFLQI